MSRFRNPGPAPLPRATKETLADIQQRQTIAHMLANGGVVTPIGPNTHIRIPSGGFGTFPSAMVEAVQKASANARAAFLAASDGGFDVG